MHKDFNGWNVCKKKTDAASGRVFFHEREVWWCVSGINVGFEQNGRGKQYARPILVFKKFNNEICWALPLTTKQKEGKFYAAIKLEDGVYRKAILSQLRLMDAKRFIHKIGTIPKNNHQEIQKAVRALCGP